jgi:hypothetical protein
VSSRALSATGGGALPSTSLVGSRTAHGRGKKPIYGKATNKRILVLLEKPSPAGYARWTGPLLAKALADVDVQYVWRFLREHNIDLAARKSWALEVATGRIGSRVASGRRRFALLKHFLMRLIVRLWMGCFPQRSVWRKRCK